MTSTDESKDNLHGILKSPTSSSIASSASSRKLFAGADAVSAIKTRKHYYAAFLFNKVLIYL